MTAFDLYFSSRNNQEFGMWLAGWGAASGEMRPTRSRRLVATRDPDTGMGSTNRSTLFQPRHSTALRSWKSRRTSDDDAREEILQRASIMAMEDYATVPLHFEVTPWAFAEGLELTPRVDQYTIAMMVRPAE